MTKLQDLQQFIKALGFGSEEPIFLRLLKPKDFDHTNPVHCKLLPGVVYDREGVTLVRCTNLRWEQSTGNIHGYADRIVSTDIIEYLTYQNKIGMAIYLVPNPGGQEKQDITEARVIYYENDTHSISDQVAKFNELNQKWGGGFAVQTKHSVHSYFRLDQTVTPQEFTHLQKRLIVSIEGSDGCIHDPCRVMRVPGFNHIHMVDNKVETQMIHVIHDWDGSFASLDTIKSQLPEVPEDKVNLNTPMPSESNTKISSDIFPSLYLFLTLDDRNNIDQGSPLGTRNSTAKRLASNLIGTANQLNKLGIRYSESPEELYELYGKHCDTAKPSELEGIWKNTLKENPTACLDDEKLITNNIAYYKRTYGTGLDLSSNVEPKTYNPGYKSILNEELDDIDTDDIRAKFSTPSANRDCWKVVRKSIPLQIAKNIEYFHGRTGISKESYVLAYLCQAASILTGKYDVFISDEWYEPLNLFYVLIGEAGHNKSSVISLFGNFHAQLNDQYRKDHDEAMKAYNKEMIQYNLQCKEDPESDYDEPEKPVQRMSALGKSTIPKTTEVLQSQLKHNLAGLCQQNDEITSILGSMDSNGGSAEVSSILSIHSGKELLSSTKCDGTQGVAKSRLCIIGTSQPKTWAKTMHQHSDENGLEDRFIISLIKAIDVKPFDHTDVSHAPFDTTSLMLEMVENFEDVSEKRYVKISSDVRPILNEKIEKWAHTNVSKFAKPKSHVYRIAGLLAILRDKDNPEINLEDINTAFALVLYSEDCKDELGRDKEATVAEGIVNKAIDLITLKGKLTASILSTNIYALRSVPLDDRYKVLEKVAEILGDKVNQDINAKGKLSLTLKDVSITPTTTPTTIEVEPVVEPIIQVKKESEFLVDEYSLHTVDLEGSKNNAIEVNIEVEEVNMQEPMIYIAPEKVPNKFRNQIKPDNLYRLISQNDTYYRVQFSDTVVLPINKVALN